MLLYAVPIIFVLTLLLPFLGLFGFFESRQGGVYRVRFGRLLMALSCLLILNVAGGVFRLSIVEQMSQNAVTIAEQAVQKDRAFRERFLDNFSILFPDVLGEETKGCFRSAFSNFVEDQWRASWREASCQSGMHSCTDSERALYEELLTAEGNKRNIVHSLSAIGTTLDTIWATASRMFDAQKSLLRTLDGDGTKQGAAEGSAQPEFQSYLARCSSLKAVSWADPSQDLLISRGGLCWGKCP